jgi:hypothetical protein
MADTAAKPRRRWSFRTLLAGTILVIFAWVGLQALAPFRVPHTVDEADNYYVGFRERSQYLDRIVEPPRTRGVN